MLEYYIVIKSGILRIGWWVWLKTRYISLSLGCLSVIRCTITLGTIPKQERVLDPSQLDAISCKTHPDSRDVTVWRNLHLRINEIWQIVVPLVPFISSQIGFFWTARREAREPAIFWPGIITMLPPWFLNHRFNSRNFSLFERWANNTSYARLFGELIKIIDCKAQMSPRRDKGWWALATRGWHGEWYFGWACFGWQ